MTLGLKSQLALILGALLACMACGPKQPVFYPNAHFDTVGEAQAKTDAKACIAEAREYGVKDGTGEKIGGRAVKGATIGAAVSAIVAAIWSRDVGRAAGAGAAGGAAGGAISGAFDAGDPDQVFKNYVHRCLKDKGYEVVGWQ